MKYFNEQDYLIFQEEAKKLGFEIIKREENNQKSEYDDINILNYFGTESDIG